MDQSPSNHPVVVLEHRDGEWRVKGVNRIYERRTGRRRREVVGAAWPPFPAEFALDTSMADERRRLEHEALHDELTGLPNRRLLSRRLNEAIADARNASRPFAVMYLDLDGFKGINDSLGHAVGDGVLRTVAARLGHVVRTGDTVARIGGDEFVLVLKSVAAPDGARRIERRLENAIRAPIAIGGQRVVVGASVGLSWYPNDGMTGDDLLHNADLSMFQLKRFHHAATKVRSSVGVVVSAVFARHP